MSEENNKKQNQEQSRRFSQQQYDMLKRCSDKKDMTEWNEWREKNLMEDVLLEGANLSGWKLKGISLSQVGVTKYIPGRLTSFVSGDVYLCGAEMKDADLEKADFRNAHLENAKFNRTHLEEAKFRDAHLEGAIFYRAHLEGADVQTAVTNGATSFWEIGVDHKTNFLGVGLDSARIDPGTKQLLEYNIRRKNWEEWYKQRKILKWPVRFFWCLSDYGISTWRIIAWFFGFAIAFAVIYRLWPNLVAVNEVVGDIRGFWHVLYFSVVTMTTLGFGDIAANPGSWWGQTLLMAQVILGYVLLGALVTRFAVLFTAGGPAGKFADDNKKYADDKVS